MSISNIKVLIVDDEYLVRNLLKKCINWDELGMEIIGEASSGEDAIEIVSQYKPDLVFTDICMTNMDGIDFADFIIKKFSDIKVIVITGYNDFKYAQRSIKAGIKDYLLKPIDDKVVLDTVLKIKKEIEKEKEALSEYNILKKQIIKNKPFFIERLLNLIIQPDSDTNEVKKLMNYLNFKFKFDNFQVSVIEIIFGNQDNYLRETEKIVYETKILNAIKEYFRPYEDIYIFFDINYKITILNNKYESNFEKDLEDIKETILNAFNYHYCIGVGNIKNGIENAEKSYKEALGSLNYPRSKKPNKLIDDISKYINLNLGDSELSQTKVAQIFFVNPSYLSRIFKKETGINFMDYLTKLRIEKAMILLKNTDLMAYEVGERVGIPDSSYFSRCFKRYIGVSASEYKKR